MKWSIRNGFLFVEEVEQSGEIHESYIRLAEVVEIYVYSEEKDSAEVEVTLCFAGGKQERRFESMPRNRADEMVGEILKVIS